jgi:hypothetical protein
VTRGPAALALCVSAALAAGGCRADEAGAEDGTALRALAPPSQPGPVALPPPVLEPGQVLDLRLGDVRRYVAVREWSAPLPEQLEDVEVIGRKGTPDMVETRPVPMGLGALFFAARHPTQIWRIFVPDPNFQLPEEDRSNK